VESLMREHGATNTSGWLIRVNEAWLASSSPLDQFIVWRRWEWWVLIGLFVLTFVTRWPVRLCSLEELDSANYALAVREFNIVKHQPHPPGYLFFVGAARFAHLWIADPIEALTAVQVMSGALAVMLFYALLRLCMPPIWALGSTLLLTFSAQVWFQHVRPMEDAYAFLWMLGVVYALVRSLSGNARWWIGGMIVLGLGMGAKQLLPVFLVGLLARTLWDLGRRKQLQVILLGTLGMGIAILTWLIPLSLHVGSAHAYVAAALSQLAWQRDHDALLFNWGPSRLSSQWRTTLALIWGPQSLALPMWGLVTLGTSQALIYHAPLRWLLWLVLPALFVRFFFLGYWPRFSLYYLPFLMPLAVVGCYALVHASVRVIRHRRTSVAQDINFVMPQRPSLWFTILGILLLLGWVTIQVGYIGPTLRVLHQKPSPVVEAMRLIREYYDPTMTVILSDNALISRQLEYYAAGAGFFSAYEPHLDGLNLDSLQGPYHVLKIQADPIPPSSSNYLGTWTLMVPRWRDLSPRDDFLHVSLYEFRGPFVLFGGWHGPELNSTRLVRWSQPEGSQIRIFRVPSHGCVIRLQGTIPVPVGWSSSPAVTIRINGDLVYEWGLENRIDLSLHVQPKEMTGDQAVINIQPGCAFIPAQMDRSSEDQRRLGCFLLTGLTIES
jgi:hypothetical protein